jgi:hypothetical protein
VSSTNLEFKYNSFSIFNFININVLGREKKRNDRSEQSAQTSGRSIKISMQKEAIMQNSNNNRNENRV